METMLWSLIFYLLDVRFLSQVTLTRFPIHYPYNCQVTLQSMTVFANDETFTLITLVFPRYCQFAL